MRSPMIYFGDSQRQREIAGEAIDVSRSVKFDAPPADASAVPAKPVYGTLSAPERAAYLRWIAGGRTEPAAEGYLHLFIAGLERRGLHERKSIVDVYDEILAQLALRQSVDERFSRLLQFAWFLVARDPAALDEVRLRALTRATPSRWAGGRVAGVLLNWFVFSRATVPAWAAYLVAARHPSANLPEQVANTPAGWASHAEQFQAAFNCQFPLGLDLGASHPQTPVEYEPINPALVKCVCEIQNPWHDKGQFDVLSQIWNSAWAQAPANRRAYDAPDQTADPTLTTEGTTNQAAAAIPEPPTSTPSATTSADESPARRVVETVKIQLESAVLKRREHSTPIPRSTPPLTPVRPPPLPHTSPPPALLRGLTWIGRDQHVRLPVVDAVSNPMIYACMGPSSEPAAIRLDLTASAMAYHPTADRELGYWPRYHELTPGQRRYYLDWIAAGRWCVPVELGYTFLYLYGLERRALLDRQDIPAIIDEVLRLKSLYVVSGRPVSRSFDGYTDNFLGFLAIREAAQIDPARGAAIRRACRSWGEDSLAAMLCRLVLEGHPLDSGLAYMLASELPDAQQGVVVRRAEAEHRELFNSRFEKQLPTGFDLQSSKRPRRYAYRPANATLESQEVVGPNPWGIQSQFKVLVDLWNACVDDLRKFSATQRSLGDTKSLTPEAWSALPLELREDIEHPLARAFHDFMRSRASAENGHVHATAMDVATALQVTVNGRMTPAHGRRISDRIGDLAYAVEPDIQLTGKKYEAEQMLAVFHRPQSPDPLNVKRYAAATCMLTVGIALAGSDGRIEEDELSVLAQQIQGAFDLNEAEERRLHALRGLLVATGVELSEVTKLLKQLDASKRELMGQLILAMVSADGVVTKEELKAVRRLYAGLGFEKNEVDDVLARLLPADPARDDETVVVAGAIAGGDGEAIPTQSAFSETAVRLNRDAIASILRESQEVARMLAAAMNLPVDPHPAEVEVQAPADEPPSKPQQPAVTAIQAESAVKPEAVADPTVPARYAAFFQLVVTKPSWSRAEIAALAKTHGLMLSGAVDAINDWSTEQKGGPLLYDDGEHFTLEQSYLN